MPQHWRILLLGIALGLGIGCRSTKTAEERAMDAQFNEHWRNGGGFSNPNVERKKNGQPPVNFNDREEPSFWDGVINGLIND